MSRDQSPLRPEPSFLAKPWGGRFLGELYGGRAAVGTGEAWLCSDLPGENGTLVKGVPLARLLRAPVPLVKVLDSTEALSVQLHPDHDLAREFHGPGYRGKWETWYFLRAPAEGFVYHGLRPETDPVSLLRDLRAGRSPEERLRKVRVSAGQSLAIPPGTVHALTAGAVVVEFQTPADLTYRLFDWGRLGLDGRPRELHLEYAEQTLARLGSGADPSMDPRPIEGQPGRYRLATTGPLAFELIRGDEAPVRLPREVTDRALAFVALTETCEVRSLTGAWSPEVLSPGECLVVPPGSGEIMVGGPGRTLLGYFRTPGS